MDLGPHAFFIIAAYGATAVIIGGLIVGAVLDHRAQLRALAELEGRGARRRSSSLGSAEHHPGNREPARIVTEP
jgi:heme exporter protein D